MNKGIIIREYSNTNEHTVTFLDDDSKHRFLRRMYLDNDDIPVTADNEDLEKLLENIINVVVFKTYVKLYINPQIYNKLFNRNVEKKVQVIIELYDIPFMYRKEAFAELRNIELSDTACGSVNSNFDDLLEEAESRVFRNDEEDDPF